MEPQIAPQTKVEPGLCRSILVVEDNQDIRESILEILYVEGYSVRCASNGKEALTVLQTLPSPTLILLDLMMPVMSGWKFLEAQKKDPSLSAHKVVVISALNATHSLEDPTPLDTVDSIQKPLELDRLLETAQRFCGKPPAGRPFPSP